MKSLTEECSQGTKHDPRSRSYWFLKPLQKQTHQSSPITTGLRVPKRMTGSRPLAPGIKSPACILAHGASRTKGRPSRKGGKGRGSGEEHELKHEFEHLHHVMLLTRATPVELAARTRATTSDDEGLQCFPCACYRPGMEDVHHTEDGSLHLYVPRYGF